MPVVRAFYNVNTTGDPIPQLKGTLDLIFAREPRPPGQPALPFQVFDGKRLVPIPHYLARHPRPDLLQLDTRMRWLSAGPYGHRAGDVLLLARLGLERPLAERFYFSKPYRSWHGSPTLQDSHIPFILARQGDSGEQLQALVTAAMGPFPSQLDFVPLVQALFGHARQHTPPLPVVSTKVHKILPHNKFVKLFGALDGKGETEHHSKCYGDSFLPCGLIVGKFLAFGIAGTRTVKMKEVERHGVSDS